MNQQSIPGKAPQAAAVRFWPWLWNSWIPPWLMLGLAGLIGLIAAIYAEEDLRGWHAWHKYQRQLQARGERLDYKTFIPAPIPDDQNFAATPFIQSWFWGGSWQDNYSRADTRIPNPEGGQGDRHFVNLVAWGEAFDAIQAGQNISKQEFRSDKLDLASRAKAAPVVLAGLQDSEAQLAELKAASQRPSTRYPVQYTMENPWGILLPHLSRIKGTTQRLKLRACAELALGRSDSALEDVKLALYVGDSLKDEPFVISYLVRVADFQITTQPIWEGLAEHAWSDAQLQVLESRLEQYNFVGDLGRALVSEEAATVLCVDLLSKDGLGRLYDHSGPSSSSSCRAADAIGAVVPSGWYALEEYNYCRLFHSLYGTVMDSASKQISPRQVASDTRNFEREMGVPPSEDREWSFPEGRERTPVGIVIRHRILAFKTLPSPLGDIARRAASAQVTADQALLACALERCRLADGSYPKNLGALVPRFIARLPNDVIGGEPYKYKGADDRQFSLYSIGWNERDDGGTPGKTLFDEKQGDWVWRYPQP